MRLFRKKIPKDNSQKVVEIQSENGNDIKTSGLLIPKEEMQSVTEVESFTVSWKVKTGWSDATNSHFKVFVDVDEAKEFRKQLEESAKFIKAWISTDLYKN